MKEVCFNVNDAVYDQILMLNKYYNVTTDQLMTKVIEAEFIKMLKGERKWRFEYKGRIYRSRYQFYEEHKYEDCRGYYNWLLKLREGQDPIEALAITKRIVWYKGVKYKNKFALYKHLLAEGHKLKSYAMFNYIARIHNHDMEKVVEYFELEHQKKKLDYCDSCGLKTEFWQEQSAFSKDLYTLCRPCLKVAQDMYDKSSAIKHGVNPSEYIISRIIDIKDGNMKNFRGVVKYERAKVKCK